jgi:hypothetical protein
MLSDGYHDVPPGKLAMVVTDLEMTSPRFRDVPLPDGLDFVPLDRDVDLYRDIFRRVGQDWLWFGRKLLADSALAAILNDPDVQLFTLLKDGRAEALLELDFRIAGACELAYFGLTSAVIGSGAGAFLMDQATALAFAQPIKRFHLHTCTIDSPDALGFYQRSGFAPIGRRIEIADDPRITLGYDQSLAPHMPLITP